MNPESPKRLFNFLFTVLSALIFAGSLLGHFDTSKILYKLDN